MQLAPVHIAPAIACQSLPPDSAICAQGLVEVFQGHSKASQNISTVADMLNFVENFSEFSAAQRNAGKHVTLMSELSRHVDARSLMQVHPRCTGHPP